MAIISILWDQVIMRPMINGLALLYAVLGHNYGVSIIVFTVFISLVTIPLTIRQTRQMKRMQELQPRMKALQEKYKGKSPEVRKQLSQETMKLYREAGVSPVGCLGPFVIQMPIWLGLYRAILRTMPPTPEGLAGLSHAFYSWNPAISLVPLSPKFLNVDLVGFVQYAPMPWQYLLPVLVGGSMWLQQKMTSGSSANMDPRSAQTNQVMLWMMPIMFGYLTYTFPAGLALYILFSNLIRMVIQYFVSGRQPIVIFGRSFLGTAETRALAQQTAATANAQAAVEDAPGESESDDDKNVHGQERRRGNRNRSARAGRRTRRRRN